jgi:hypothetical protein
VIAAALHGVFTAVFYYELRLAKEGVDLRSQTCSTEASSAASHRAKRHHQEVTSSSDGHFGGSCYRTTTAISTLVPGRHDEPAEASHVTAPRPAAAPVANAPCRR